MLGWGEKSVNFESGGAADSYGASGGESELMG